MFLITLNQLGEKGADLDHLLSGLDDDEVGGQVDPQGQRAGRHQHRQVVTTKKLASHHHNSRVAGTALFGWSRSPFFGPAPTPTLL